MLTLQFGQCGNQLGNALYTNIVADIESRSSGNSTADLYDYIECSSSKWFERSANDNSKRHARAILIDTERKVIEKVIHENKYQWCFRPGNIVTTGSSGGSANNWSFGYLNKGRDFEESVFEIIRSELERVDKLDGFLCLLGCAGGTGSGLGSFIIHTLRHNFSTKNIIGALVFPFTSGEIATQNYNVSLSLAKIVDDADIIIMLENERLDKELLSQLSDSSKINAQMDYPVGINDIASQKIVSIFQPARNIINDRFNNVNNLITKLVPHPAYKLATIEAVPLHLDKTNFGKSPLSHFQRDSLTWQLHFRSLIRNLFSNHYSYYCYPKVPSGNNTVTELSSNHHGVRSLSNILITRGFTDNKHISHRSHNYPNICNKLNEDGIYAEIDWFPLSERFTHFHQNRRLFNKEKFAAIISNNSRINKLLVDIMSKAWRCYTHGAYLHQYKKYGLEDDDFLRAFAKIENLIASYKDLESKSPN